MSRAMGSHQSSRAGTHTWLTPLPLVRSLGPFGVDPCAVPGHQTADRLICLPEDGLAADWRDDRAWVNPPYGNHLSAWLGRLAHHGKGTAFVFARTETAAFFEGVWNAATALLFLEGREHFHWAFPGGVTGDPTGCAHVWAKMEPEKPKSGLACTVCGMAQANSGAPSVLVAYGMADADVLAGAPVPGAFIPLLIPRSMLVPHLDLSWSEVMRAWLARQPNAVSVADAYRFFARHPKTRGREHWRAQVRKQLQQVGRRVAPNTYTAAEAA